MLTVDLRKRGPDMRENSVMFFIIELFLDSNQHHQYCRFTLFIEIIIAMRGEVED